MINLLMVTCLILTVSSCSTINKALGLKDDNDVEQRVEEVIEQETGVKVDLTPEVKKEEAKPSTSTKNEKKQASSKNVPKKS